MNLSSLLTLRSLIDHAPMTLTLISCQTLKRHQKKSPAESLNSQSLSS